MSKYKINPMKQGGVFKKVVEILFMAKKVSKEKGVCRAVHSGVKMIINSLRRFFHHHFLYYQHKVFKSSRTFSFQGNKYFYFYHKYNNAWTNERVVEVPIIWEMVKKYHGKNILEVGNVLSHYFFVNHDILDKYEGSDGIINEDAANFQPSHKYDLIVSISTLEHVGWDEEPRNPMKILRVVENLKTLLSPRGKMVVTLPLGYNLEMDKLLNEGKIQFTKIYFLKRISRDNKWVETDRKCLKKARYGYPFSNANGLVIGVIDKD